jgi:peptidoglycan/xylan/chitin deacetylase (PgdA/CDA1 family)
MRKLKIFIINFLIYFKADRLISFMGKASPRVLMYHRINNNPLTRGLKTTLFEKQLIQLKNRYDIVSLTEVFIENKDIKNSLVITFDDGHEDFYLNAWPILKRLNIPATLFITTDFINNTHWLWPDYLHHIIFENYKKNLPVSFNGKIFSEIQPISLWGKLADECLSLNKNQIKCEIDLLIQQLSAKPLNMPSENYRGLSAKQLIEMSHEGLDIQCHTKSHPILKNCSKEDLYDEIVESKLYLESLLEKEIFALCYPNGRYEDISELTVNITKASGYKLGFLARNYLTQSPYLIGRISASHNTNQLIWRLARNTLETADHTYLKNSNAHHDV